MVFAVSAAPGIMPPAVFAQDMSTAASSIPQQTGVGSAFELTFWQSVATSNDARQYQAYLTRYPQGTFSELARAKIAALGGEVKSPVTAPAPVASAPAPLAAPVVAPVPAAPPPAAIALPVPQPVPTPTAAPAAPPPQALAQRLAAASAAATGLEVAAPTLPAAPQLAAVTAPVLPERFCSASERNSFHDAQFVPAQQRAEQNNALAIAYLRQLQSYYDKVSSDKDHDAINGAAMAARDYQTVARQAYEDSAAYDALFTRMMSRPVGGCSKHD